MFPSVINHLPELLNFRTLPFKIKEWSNLIVAFPIIFGIQIIHFDNQHWGNTSAAEHLVPVFFSKYICSKFICLPMKSRCPAITNWFPENLAGSRAFKETYWNFPVLALRFYDINHSFAACNAISPAYSRPILYSLWHEAHLQNTISSTLTITKGCFPWNSLCPVMVPLIGQITSSAYSMSLGKSQ